MKFDAFEINHTGAERKLGLIFAQTPGDALHALAERYWEGLDYQLVADETVYGAHAQRRDGTVIEIR